MSHRSELRHDQYTNANAVRPIDTTFQQDDPNKD